MDTFYYSIPIRSQTTPRPAAADHAGRAGHGATKGACARRGSNESWRVSQMGYPLVMTQRLKMVIYRYLYWIQPLNMVIFHGYVSYWIRLPSGYVKVGNWKMVIQFVDLAIEHGDFPQLRAPQLCLLVYKPQMPQ